MLDTVYLYVGLQGSKPSGKYIKKIYEESVKWKIRLTNCGDAVEDGEGGT